MRITSMLIVTLLCSGCVTGSRMNGPPATSPSTVPPGFTAAVRTSGMDRHSFSDAGVDTAVARLAVAGHGSINILALSGGGAGGAFGAGILVGLSHAGTRPQYDVVTGVSTGALMAPFAFLGTEWDVQLAQAYSGDASSDLMHRYRFTAIFRTALYKGQPLRDLVNRFVTDELMAAVTRESGKGRLLLVATTNLDQEEAVIWNLGNIAAAGGAHARSLFVDVLVASASMPGVFPPVMIEVQEEANTFQEMHVDGGATVPFFIAPNLVLALGNVPDALRGANVYMISNSQLGGGGPPTTPVNVGEIISRSLTTMMNHMTRAALAQTEAFAARNQMSVRFTTIPPEFPYGGSLAFNQAEMHALFAYGQRCCRRQQLMSNPSVIDVQFPLCTAIGVTLASLSTARTTLCRRQKRMPLCYPLAAPPERIDRGRRLAASVDFPVVRSDAFAWHVAI
jgi:predicted acylesterase/phospholipase RssA